PRTPACTDVAPSQASSTPAVTPGSRAAAARRRQATIGHAAGRTDPGERTQANRTPSGEPARTPPAETPRPAYHGAARCSPLEPLDRPAGSQLPIRPPRLPSPQSPQRL